MKLEFSIALKYLVPRKGGVSSAFISLFSIGIISLVVWLSLVFISVIHGLEQRWLHDLSQLHSPITMVPSEAYYNSYYYQVDKHSESSNYTTKTLGEKLSSLQEDPYDSEVDYQLPEVFPCRDCNNAGVLKDPVKIAVKSLQPYLNEKKAQLLEFEEGIGYLQLDPTSNLHKPQSRTLSHFITYPSNSTTYQEKVLPYDETDYSSSDLNPFNRSSHGWREDFHRLETLYQGAAVILPHAYKELGYQVGSLGKLSTYSLATQKETFYPVHVIGFYNSGLSPLGSKTIFIDPELTTFIRASSEGLGMTNGFHIFFSNTKEILPIKNQIEKILISSEIHKYWDISSLYDYDYFKPILDQLQSDEVLFLFVAILILTVACSNVMTMSILLVNNKKKEIGILKAMGASPQSLKAIFACCGAVSGAFGVILGTLLALLTLKNLQSIVEVLSYLQGREAFNTTFFGQNLPNKIHPQAIYFLGFGTLILAAISGALPARKIAKMQVSEILKAD
ncbi:ABC transporter permease [Candidatus Chlamydia sanziniae]|uniref:Lipoprotein releasing system transmembrane protein LolE n=1 Tax=Candidatus Chlamydia sanziniae TaxID=1806891 RepID=A0A1A9HY37_9CHLA|nr:FtsX-like permease family protein [Candidatus Chlamydia sanziniae]ANH79002.1 Lipoprotein releasing system transmembrane protein LolE [Candidatus Chlamydia sanziniae]